MNWHDIGQAVGTVAPKLGGAIAGPGGQFLGTMAARALGLEPTPEALAAFMQSDPEAYVKLKQVERDMEFDRLQDIQHAREHVHDEQARRRLAAFIVPAPIALMLVILWLQPTDAMLAIASSVLGYAVSEARAIYAFYFGTSLGSKRKGQNQEQTITDLTEWRKNRAA